MNAAPAAIFTGGGTNTSQDCWQSDVFFDGSNRIPKFAGGNLTNHERDVHLRRTNAMAGCHTISDVVAQQQFQRRPSRLLNFIRFTFDFHSLSRYGCAGGDKPVVDFYYTRQAGRRGLISLSEAKGWYVHFVHRRLRLTVNSQLASSIKNRTPRFDFNITIVNCQFYHFY